MRRATKRSRPPTRLSRQLVTEITDAIRAGASLSEAVGIVRAARWESSSTWLDVSAVYEWLRHARDGYGSAAEVRFAKAVRAAELARDAGSRPPYIIAEVTDLAAIERRLQALEVRVSKLTGLDP